LGRMLALAAARLGLTCHVYAPEADSPAFAVSAARTVAAYEDEVALASFAADIQAATFEFENVPVETIRFLEGLVPVRPGARALAVAQDRLAEKRLARALGADTADFSAVDTEDDLVAALERIGCPAVLKTVRFGYDGKGQAKIVTLDDAAGAFAAMRGQAAILESFVRFSREVSVVAARGTDGAFKAFDVTENEHRHHILHRSIAPAGISADTAAQAVAIAGRIAEALDYVGVLGVEFFVSEGPAGESLAVNEIAPRVHNSGHWTMDGAATCQFEQHIRAVAGWPLGSTRRLAAQVEMINLIGEDAAGWASILHDPAARLHLYGKTQMRAGRKMGHVNRLLR
jgi:5-(carboxyamino)imidazole ribonucleotide synthase